MSDYEDVHTEVTHLVHVRLPYGLKPSELKLEPGCDEFELDRLGEFTEDELKRIIVSAALLINTGINYTVGQCLETAVIWERG